MGDLLGAFDVGTRSEQSQKIGNFEFNMYLERLEKKLLAVGNAIGSYSPTQDLVSPPPDWPEVIA